MNISNNKREKDIRSWALSDFWTWPQTRQMETCTFVQLVSVFNIVNFERRIENKFLIFSKQRRSQPEKDFPKQVVNLQKKAT